MGIAREQRGRSSKSLQHSKTRDLNFQDLEGLYVPGEVVKLGLSFAHLPEPAQLIYSSHKPGAVSFGEEMVRAITGLTLVREANSGLFEEEDEPTNEFMMGDRVLHKKNKHESSAQHHTADLQRGVWAACSSLCAAAA